MNLVKIKEFYIERDREIHIVLFCLEFLNFDSFANWFYIICLVKK